MIDGKLISAISIQIDESSLTSESFPQEKITGDEVFGSTLVLSGEGLLEVTQTGGKTRVGRLSSIAEEIQQPKTPLQLAMKTLFSSCGKCDRIFRPCRPVQHD